VFPPCQYKEVYLEAIVRQGDLLESSYRNFDVSCSGNNGRGEGLETVKDDNI
jgi:hypothetical protein